MSAYLLNSLRSPLIYRNGTQTSFHCRKSTSIYHLQGPSYIHRDVLLLHLVCLFIYEIHSGLSSSIATAPSTAGKAPASTASKAPATFTEMYSSYIYKVRLSPFCILLCIFLCNSFRLLGRPSTTSEAPAKFTETYYSYIYEVLVRFKCCYLQQGDGCSQRLHQRHLCKTSVVCFFVYL